MFRVLIQSSLAPCLYPHRLPYGLNCAAHNRFVVVNSWVYSNVMAIFRRGRLMHVGQAKIAILDEHMATDRLPDIRRESRFLLLFALLQCEQQQRPPPCSLSHIPPRISESLFITTSIDDHDEEKRREENVSEAEVTNNRRLRY